MIIVTGAAGFIGSAIVAHLNKQGERDITVVDVLRKNDQWKNLRGLDFNDYLDRSQLPEFLQNRKNVRAVVHMGACSSTTEQDAAYLMENNYRYTLNLARHCTEHNIRFIYASSAATYGMGEHGYEDDESRLQLLKPMNMYGYSKQLFDLKARREGWCRRIVGLKFFNVYGPNEYFKGDMASVIFKAFNQIKESGQVKLFKSHHPDFTYGGQLRDFVYVKDAVNVIQYLLEYPQVHGIYNVGTGKARSFKDLAVAVFKAMNLEPNIKYIEMPESIRDRYQYFTEARMDKLMAAGYKRSFYSFEDGVGDYIQNYLMKGFEHL